MTRHTSNVFRIVHDEANEVMLYLFCIKTDVVGYFCQLIKHAIYVVVHWLVFDSFKDFAQSFEFRGDL